MQTVLIVISSVLTVVAVLPYILDIIRGKTKPRLVTWFTWGLLSVITSAAAYSDGQYPAGILTTFGAAGCFAVVVLGWHHGNRKFERLDIVCQIGALAGIGLWLTFDSPALAIITTTIVDLIGAIPTIVHSWHQPHEETWITYFLSGTAALLTVFAADNWQITSLLAPAYFFIFNLILTTILLIRKKYSVPGKPPALLEV
jgi:hypothetical protein